jgi:tetratricopeptide (TPR) repeat protein
MGVADLERSVELADRANAPDEIGKSRNNLANIYWMLGRLDDATAMWEASREAAVRYGSRAGRVWADAELLADRDTHGDLVGALELADQVIADTNAGEQVHNAGHGARSKLLASFGRLDEALAESEQVLAKAREVADSQHLAPSLLVRACVLFAAGRNEEARAAIDEVLADPRLVRVGYLFAELPLLLAEEGREADFTAAVRGIPQLGLWSEAATAVCDGDLARAADVYGAMGARFFEAWARLLAAERGELGQLEQARAYFVSQGALPYVRRCEALLHASA